MELAALKPVFEAQGSLYGALFEATRSDPAPQRELESRWNDIANDLRRQEAPLDVIERVKAMFFEPTHHPGVHGRLLVLSEDQEVLDLVLPSPPHAPSAFYASAPPLLEALTALESLVTALVVEVDRSGASFTWIDSSHGEPVMDAEDFDGGHDVLHKVHSGGWSHRRLHQRAEDSWERNAQACAEQLVKLVEEYKPDLVILSGDVRARTLVRKSVNHGLKILEIDGGRRAEGYIDPAFQDKVFEVMDAYRLQRRADTAQSFAFALSHGEAVTGLAPTLEALRLGQVEALVVGVDDTGTPELNLEGMNLWVGSDARQVALKHSHLSSAASLGIAEMPADAALVRALLAQDANYLFAPSEILDLEDCVGAFLRWPLPASAPHTLAAQEEVV